MRDGIEGADSVEGTGIELDLRHIGADKLRVRNRTTRASDLLARAVNSKNRVSGTDKLTGHRDACAAAKIENAPIPRRQSLHEAAKPFLAHRRNPELL